MGKPFSLEERALSGVTRGRGWDEKGGQKGHVSLLWRPFLGGETEIWEHLRFFLEFLGSLRFQGSPLDQVSPVVLWSQGGLVSQ